MSDRPDPEVLDYIDDMREAVEKIERYVDEMTFEEELEALEAEYGISDSGICSGTRESSRRSPELNEVPAQHSGERRRIPALLGRLSEIIHQNPRSSDRFQHGIRTAFSVFPRIEVRRPGLRNAS